MKRPASLLLLLLLCLTGKVAAQSLNRAYGANYDHLYSFDLATNSITALHTFSGSADGFGSSAGVVFNPCNTILYGSTQAGGANGKGVIYSYNIVTATYSVLLSLPNSGLPMASPIFPATCMAFPKPGAIWATGICSNLTWQAIPIRWYTASAPR